MPSSRLPSSPPPLLPPLYDNRAGGTVAITLPPAVEGVVVVDRDGRVLHANLAGVIDDPARNTADIGELIPELDRREFDATLRDALASGEPRVILLAPSARTAALSMHISPTPGAAATIVIEALPDIGRRLVPSRSAREAIALGEVALEVHRSLVPDRVFELIARHAATLLGAEAARVMLLDGADVEVRAAYGGVHGTVGTRVPVATTICGEAVRTRRPVRTDDLRAEPRRWPGAISPLDAARVNSIAVPLLLDGEPFGAIAVFGNPTRDFHENDATFLTALASHAVNAIENSRLFAAQQQDREQAEAAAAIARAALDGGSIGDGARRMLLELGRFLQVPGLSLAVIEDEGATIHHVAALGIAERIAGLRMPLATSLTKGTFPDGQPLAIPSLRMMLHPEYRDRVPESSWVILPLYSRGQLIGLVGAAEGSSHRLSPPAVQAFTRLAPTLALAIDALRLGEVQQLQRARQQLLASALETLTEPILILDVDASIRYANAAAEREYGFTDADFTRRSLWDLRADRDRPVPPAQVDAHLAAHGTWHDDVVHRRADGSCFPAAVSHTLIRDEHGSTVGRVVRTSDLTDSLRAEDQRRQTEKMAALGALVAGVAHELNNPLTGISAFAQLLMEEPLTGDQVESVRLIKREADRAGAVIRDLLHFSRKSHEQRSLVDLNECVDLALRLRAHGFRNADIDVVVQLEPELPRVHADCAKLQQVLLNLIVNAEQAMERSPVRCLTIRTRGDDESVTLEVSDTGTGMPPEIQAHIFEPFFTTKPAGSGTGLGLSVSYGIIQSHGGTCTVRSAPGDGTTFRVILPIASTITGSQA